MFVFYGISLSIGPAVVSWYWFEDPFLRLKDRIPYGRPVESSIRVLPITGDSGCALLRLVHAQGLGNYIGIFVTAAGVE